MTFILKARLSALYRFWKNLLSQPDFSPLHPTSGEELFSRLPLIETALEHWLDS